MNKQKFESLQQWFDDIVQQTPEQQQASLAKLKQTESDLLPPLLKLLSADHRTKDLTAQWLHLDESQWPSIHETLNTGDILGDYVIQKTIATGGMGTVYLAHHQDPNVKHQVAIKMVRADRIESMTLQRFTHEIAVLSRLNHPNIASLLSTGIDQHQSPYLVMEYVHGDNLIDHCQHNHLSREALLSLFVTVCQAVEYAHNNLIIHRDLKPSNIKVTDQGMVKLLDFGIAKSLGQHAPLHQTATLQRVFSPSHVAPEQLKGDGNNISGDIYALGVLLYQLLTGHVPLSAEGKSFGEFEHDILHTDPKPPSHHVNGIPKDLDSIVMRCLRKIPTQRYPNVSALADDIQRFDQGMPVTAHEGKFNYQIRKFFKRHWLASSVTALLAMAFVVLGLNLYQQYAEARYQNDRAQSSIDILTAAFEMVDPTNSLGNKITAEQILEQSLRLLETQYNDRPLLKADLLLTIAAVQFNIGENQEAERILDIIASHLNKSAEPDPSLRYRFYKQKASIKRFMHQPHQAITLVDQAKPLTSNVSEQVALENIRLHAITDSRDYVLAESMAKTIIESHIKKMEVSDPNRWVFLDNYAQLLKLQGNYPDAMALLKQIHTEKQQHLKPDAPQIASGARRLISMHSIMHQFDQGLALLEPVKKQYTKLYGQNSLNFAKLLTTEANLYSLKPEANYDVLANYRQAHDIYVHVYGASHPSISMSHFNIAITMDSQQKPFEATAEQFRQAIKIANQVYDPNHRNILLFNCIFALYLNQHGQFEETIKTLKKGFVIADAVPEYKQYDFFQLANMAYSIAQFKLTRAPEYQQQLDDIVANVDEFIEYTEKDFFAQLSVAKDIGMTVGDIEKIRKNAKDAIKERQLNK